MKEQPKTERLEIRITPELKQKLKQMTQTQKYKNVSELVTEHLSTISAPSISSQNNSELHSHESHIESCLILNQIMNCLSSHPDCTDNLKNYIQKELKQHVIY